MNANTSRQSPAERENGTELFSRTARDLPAGRHQFHKERLMAQIQQEQHIPAAAAAPRRRRLTRPVIALPVLATAVAAAFVAVSLTQGQEAPGGLGTGPVLTTPVGVASTAGLPQLVDRIALAAAEETHPEVGPGQYVYVESKDAGTYVKVDHGKPSLVGMELHTRQVWESADGTKGWLIDPAVNDDPEGETLSLPDEQGNTPEATLNAPSYDYLTKLTTDPDALLAKIYKETEGMGNSPDQQAFTTIGDLLNESYPPAKLYPALFKAAAKIPGVVVVNDAVDAAGRHGVAVARLDEHGGAREEWIFDKKTHVFLGERSVQVEGSSGEGGLIRPGTVISTSAVMKRAVVDGLKETPSGR
ncbi:CU044_5270 family protein [Streptomyces sp. NPDC093094]|uniref:CU044_5270 family protein n=1 Tax=Streptomyces sp. NPDC093094 TaxID=3366026 RepID=UPI0038146C43